MSSDLIGRRRASEQRLDRARSLEASLKERIDLLVQTTGMSIEQLDFDGSFRAALTALAALAARRTHFDIIVTLPDAPFAMRIQQVNNAVSTEVLIQRDGPFEPVSNPSAAGELASTPAYSALVRETPTYAETPAAYAAIPAAASYAAIAPSAPRSEPVPRAQVASDLAELLWQGVDHMPS